MTTIGFIGLGSMGSPMAHHMFDALPDQDTMVLNNRGRTPVEDLIERGAIWAETAREVGEQADIVFLMVPDVPQINEVLDSDEGLLAGVTSDTLVVVCSTVSPEAVRELDARVADQTDGVVRVIDAPVSGGEVGAIAGTLSIMMGGDEELVAKAMPYLSLTGRPQRFGPLGAGQIVKACNQLICAANIVANAEAAIVAERAGIDVAAMFELLKGGYAGSKVMEDKGPRYANRDYSLSGAAEFWIKDLKAYLDGAEAAGTRTMQGDRLLEAFQGVVDAGWGREDTSIVHKWIDEVNPVNDAAQD